MKKDICIILSLLLYTFQLPIIYKVEYPVTVKRKILSLIHISEPTRPY